MDPNQSHIRTGGIFIGICAVLGAALFLLDQGRSILAGWATLRASEHTIANLSSNSLSNQVGNEEDEELRVGQSAPAGQEPGTAQTDGTSLTSGISPNGLVTNLGGRAQTFVDEYYSIVSGDADSVMPWLADHYAENVDFFGKQTSRNSILYQKGLYLRRWPERSYRLISSSMNNTCDSGTMLCYLTGTMAFDVSSPTRGATSRGLASFAMTTDFSGATPLIVSETSRVLSREPAARPLASY